MRIYILYSFFILFYSLLPHTAMAAEKASPSPKIQIVACVQNNTEPSKINKTIENIAKKQISVSVGKNLSPTPCLVAYDTRGCRVLINAQTIDCNPNSTKECPTVVTWNQPEKTIKTWKDAGGTCGKGGTKDKQAAKEKSLFDKKYDKKTNNKEIEKLQRKLKKEGFDPGKIDGRWGKNTQKALEKFKKTNANRSTSLNNNQQVKALQDRLQKAGFNPGIADGKMGKKTRRALQAFQAANGLPPTGNINPQTAKALITAKSAPRRNPYTNGRFTVQPDKMAKMIQDAISKQPLINGKKITPQQMAAFLRQENTLMRQYGKNSEGNRDGYGQVNKQTRKHFAKLYNQIYGKPKGSYIQDAQRQINTAATVLNTYANSKRYGCNGNVTCAVVAYNAGPNGRTFRNYKRGRSLNRITSGYVRAVPRYIQSFSTGNTPSYGRGRTYLGTGYAHYYWGALSRALNE